MEIKKTLLIDQELQKEYEVVIPKEIIDLKADEEILEIQKNYKLNGFRPGKVPLNVIKEKEWAYIFSKTCENAVNDVVHKIVEENKYELSVRPNVSMNIMEKDKDIEFKVVYELLPKIEYGNLGDINIDNYEIEISDTDVEKTVKKVLSTYKNWQKKDGTAELGDSVKINFVGTINGEEFDGGKAEGYQLELGSHSFIDNFEEQIVGKMAGDELDVNVTFPDNYHKSSLAGKPALFKVSVLEVLEASDKELTDEFVKSAFGVESVEKFKELIVKELKNNYENTARILAREKVTKELLNSINFNLPEKMVEEQFKILLEYKQKENIKNSVKDPINESELRKEAEELVKASLIVSQIGKDNNISANDNEVTQAIMKNVMSIPGQEKQLVDYYKKNHDAVLSIKNEIIRIKILDFILDKVNKNVIKTSIEELDNILKKRSN